MSIKAQLLKYALCTVLYFLVCIILIKTRQNCKIKETISVTIKNQPQSPYFPTSDRIIKKNVESEINMLRIDELKGGTIDQQV